MKPESDNHAAVGVKVPESVSSYGHGWFLSASHVLINFSHLAIVAAVNERVKGGTMSRGKPDVMIHLCTVEIDMLDKFAMLYIYP